MTGIAVFSLPSVSPQQRAAVSQSAAGEKEEKENDFFSQPKKRFLSLSRLHLSCHLFMALVPSLLIQD